MGVLKRVKVKWQCRVFFFKIDHGLFRVIGLKLGGEPRPVFEIYIFSLLPYIAPPYHLHIQQKQHYYKTITL